MEGEKFLEYARTGNHKGLKKMLDNDQDPNISDDSGMSALMYASEMGHLKCVQLLLQIDNIEVNAMTKSTRRTALMLATKKNHSNIVGTLVEMDNIDVTLEDYHGETAIYFAIRLKFPRCVEILIHSGKIDQKSVDITPAISPGHPFSLEVLDILLKAGCLVNGIVKNGIQKQRPLMRAAATGNIDIVKRMLQEKTIDVHFDTKTTPMTVAASSGDVEMVKLLSENGFIYDYHSVHAACSNGRVEVIEFMRGADIHKGAMACTIAAMHKKKSSSQDLPDLAKVLDILIRRHADPNVYFKNNQTPLTLVVKNYIYSFKLLKRLEPDQTQNRRKEQKRLDFALETLKKLNSLPNLDPNKPPIVTPVITCIREPEIDIELLKELLKNPRIRLDKPTYIKEVCRTGRVDILDLFMKDPRTNKSEMTLSFGLNIAIRKNYSNIVNYFLYKTDVNVNQIISSGETPLSEAIMNNRVEIFKMLVGFAKTDVNAEGMSVLEDDDSDSDLDDIRREMTPLLQTLYLRRTSLFKLLLKVPRIDVNKKSRGISPLTYVVQKNDLEKVKLLLELRANIYDTYLGDTVLHDAAYKNQPDILHALLFYESDDTNPNILNHLGNSPLFCACSEGHIECVKVLASHPNIMMDVGKYNESSLRIESPLFAACCYGHVDLAKYLFKLHMDKEITLPEHKEEYKVDAIALRKRLALEFLSKSQSTTRGTRDDTLLTISTFNGHRDVVEWLISLGVDLDEPNSSGLTAVTIASRKGYVFLVKLLTNAGGHGVIEKVQESLRKRKQTDMILNRRAKLPPGVRQNIGSFLRVKSKKPTLKF